MADVVSLSRQGCMENRVEPLPRYKVAHVVLPMITVGVLPDAAQLSIPYGNEPRSIALAHRVAARAIESLADLIREGRVDPPAVVLTRWSVAVRIEGGVGFVADVASTAAGALEIAARNEARAGARATHRVVRK